MPDSAIISLLKQEIIVLKERMLSLENKLDSLGVGSQKDIDRTSGDVTVSDTGEYAEGFAPLDTPTLAESVAKVRQATIAVRGYGMLLDQMHFSKDQKKMIKEVEEIMMSVLKLVNAMKVLAVTGAADPFGWFVAAGMISSSFAYGSKASGSGI